MQTGNTTIFLSSSSPQRKKILDEVGINFSVIDCLVNEVTLATPQETVVANAKIKSLAALSNGEVKDGSVVLSADTVLSTGDNSLGKPNSMEEAKAWLKTYSGQHITSYSAIGAAQKGHSLGYIVLETATVEFDTITDDLIDWYIKTGEPLSRAGAFGISLLGEIFVKSIQGSFSCVAGLPKKALIGVLSLLCPGCISPSIPLFMPTGQKITEFEICNDNDYGI